MDWIPLHQPRPEDGKRYDIRLKDGTVVTDVAFWDYGCGFEPLEIGASSPGQNCHVKYPMSQVVAFRPTLGPERS